MADHIIVIFDRSGSMGSPFQADRERARFADDVGPYETKIVAAHERLIVWLRKSQFELVTIIPFHSNVDASFTASLRDEQNSIESFIRSQRPGDSTNLQIALSTAIKIGLKEPTDSYVPYLIVTDGLSDTVKKDIELVDQIPKRQAVNGILIDPTPAGEAHLKRLCVRGSYVSVASSGQLTEALAEREAVYLERIQLNRSYQDVAVSNRQALNRLEHLNQRLYNYPPLKRKLGQLVSRAVSEAHQIEDHWNIIGEKIANQRIPVSTLIDERKKLLQQQEKFNAVINLLEKCYQSSPRMDISLSHPKLLSKRFTTPFIVRLYLPHRRNEVEVQQKDELREWGLTEQIYNSDLVAGLAIVVKLKSQEIRFSDAVVKKLEDTVNTISFTAKPDDECHPGAHAVLLSIANKETKHEYESIVFRVQVIDFAFDHISRPLVSNLASVILGVGSLTTFILTLLGQIDTTFGLASGTAAGALATFIYSRFQLIYNRPNTIVNKP